MAKRKRADDDADYADQPRTAPARTKTRPAPKPPQSSDASFAAPSHPASRHILSQPEPLQTALLAWYSTVHDARRMPWRKPYDPSFDTEERAQRAYEVWVSEVMLQQTQVATVIPYYNRWMQQFPTIRHLASSDIDTINSIWKGLGYYSRAARLLAGAKKAVEDFDGRLPDNAKDMESRIPGIGRYSAGAICSIAYNECVPVLDGNVHRLLSRLLALHAPPKVKATLDVLWSAAATMVRAAARPGDVNQALIELGSTVCKPRDPDCAACALRPWCGAYRASAADPKPSVPDLPDIEELCTLCEPIPLSLSSAAGTPEPPVTSYPMKAERKKQREETDVVNVVEWRNASSRWFLLVRRPEGGLLAGLHEFPTSPNVPTPTTPAELKRLPHTLLLSLLKVPPLPLPSGGSAQDATRSKPAARAQEAAGASAPAPGAACQIVKVKPAGDVLHVFSHIRKTYRVQWLVLEGGGDAPPELAVPEPEPAASRGGRSKPKPKPEPKAKGKSRKKRSSTSDEDDEDVEGAGEPASASALPCTAMWVPLDQVENQNVGTGVMKVWKLARAQWERGGGGGGRGRGGGGLEAYGFGPG